jgi:hypothetical protein
MLVINTTSGYAFATDDVAGTALTLADIGFTDDEIRAAQRARITVAAFPIRYTYEGTTPTASVGHYLAADGETELVGNENISNLQVIRATGSTGVISITLEA